MISLKFEIRYPWTNSKFKTLFYRAWKTPFKHKFFEIQLVRDYADLICIDLHWKLKGDHAGVRLELGLFGYAFMFELYDSRHWDHNSDAWAKYN